MMDPQIIAIETKGLCLACFSKCSPPTLLQSFKALMRYMDIDMYKLTNFPSTLLTDSIETTQFSVSLCSPCQVIVNEFFEKFQAWENLQLQMKQHIQQLYTQMTNADQDVERVQEFKTRMRANVSFGDIFNASVSGNLRKSALEKCSQISDELESTLARPVRENQPSPGSSRSPLAHMLTPQHSGDSFFVPCSILASHDLQFGSPNIVIPLRQSTSHDPVVFTPPNPNDFNDWSGMNTTTNNSSIYAPGTSGQHVHSPDITRTGEDVDVSTFKQELYHSETGASYEMPVYEYRNNNDIKPIIISTTSSATPNFNCNKCQKSFYTAQRLHSHKKKNCNARKRKLQGNMTTTVTRPIPCTKCDMVFQHKGAFTMHMKSHGDSLSESQFRHQCLYCKCGFKHQSNRQVHMFKMHTYQMLT